LQLLFILPYTIQYSLVVNDSEEVFTIDGQVYSTLPNLECLQQQGVRCSSPEADWTTCLAAGDEDCANLDWQLISKKVERAREKLRVDVAQAEDNVKKAENDIKRTVQEIDSNVKKVENDVKRTVQEMNSNLKKKMDRINSKIEKMMAKINKRF